MNKSPLFDVVIVGGAMTGATLALALDKLNRDNHTSLTIALIEGGDFGAKQSGFDGRAIALNRNSIDFLTHLDLWATLSPDSTPIKSISVSDKGHFGKAWLDSQDYQVDSFGAVVELNKIQAPIYHALKCADVTLFYPNKAANIDTRQAEHHIELDDGQCLRAKLLVAADGTFSTVRGQLNQAIVTTELSQWGEISCIKMSQPHQNVAHERFTANGPVALLPLASDYYSVVWAMDKQAQQAHQALTEQQKSVALARIIGPELGQIESYTTLGGYPLDMHTMPRPIFHRTLFVGNAAQTLHPIAGQGFNLGLRDVQTVYQLLQSEANSDVGEVGFTHQYWQQRRGDREQIMLSIRTLLHTFSSDNRLLALGRNLALQTIQMCPALKQSIVLMAMGFRGK